MALNTHIAIGSFGDILKTPKPEVAEKLFQNWKDVPWKGDVLIRVGHGSSIKEDMQRFMEMRAYVGKKVNPIEKGLTALSLSLSNVMTKIMRADHYNPLTRQATVYHPNYVIGMHEIGHAWDYDKILAQIKENPKKKGKFRTRLKVEWEASANAMKQFTTDEERKMAMKKLEPAYGSYIGMFFGKLTGLLWMISIYAQHKGKTNPEVLKKVKLARKVGAYGAILGILSGHVTSRLPGRKGAFGYIFENAPEPQFVYTGTGKAAV